MTALGEDIRRLFGRSGRVFLYRVSGAFLVFVTQILLARWMGAKELGIYTYSFSWCILLATVVCFGYPAISVRFISQSLERGEHGLIKGFIYRGQQLIILTSTLVVLVGLGLYFNVPALRYSEYADTMLVALIAIPLFALARFQDKIAQSFSWFELGFFPNSTIRPLLFLLMVGVFWFIGTRHSAQLAMLLQLSAIILIVGNQYYFIRKKMAPFIATEKPQYQTQLWFKASLPMLLIVIFTQYFADLAVIIIGVQLLPEEIAVFNISFRITLLISFVYHSVNAVMLPKLSRLYATDDMAGIQHIVSRANRVNVAVSVVALIGLWLLGKELLGLFGDEFVVGYPVLLVLGVSQLVIAAMGPAAGLLTISGNQNRCIPVFAISIMLIILLTYLLLPLYGLQGAAIMVVLTTLFWTTGLHIIVSRRLKLRASGLF